MKNRRPITMADLVESATRFASRLDYAAPASAPVFGDDRVREKQAGGHVAQHKAERERAKFPRKRK